ncbi:MAG: hypothetical protein JSS53_10350, partial [Proteobacteria bacterium]|nr:hypothetical protein [Pseudomonadota bacterium]
MIHIPPMVPACSHPLTVILVDDNLTALESTELVLEEHFPCKKFSDPIKALEYLNNEYREKPYTERAFEITGGSEPSSQDRKQTLFFERIHHEVYRPERFRESNVVIMDHAMPIMKGMECAALIKNRRLLIIMLTGEASMETGLEGLNEKIITRYIRKDQEDFQSILIPWIYQGVYDYFSFHSLPIINALTKNSAITDEAYINLVNQIKSENGIIEHYLTDTAGSLVMFDRDAVPSWLAIISEDQIKQAIDYGIRIYVSQSNIDAMIRREKMPYVFADSSEGRVISNEWDKYLHPATLLVGKRNYY